MSIRPIIDAGPGLNFLSANKERLLRGWPVSTRSKAKPAAGRPNGRCTRWPSSSSSTGLRAVPAAEARELKDGVEGDFEGPGVALNLREDEAALERGEQGDGEVVRVGAVREVPGGVQPAAASMILARVRFPWPLASGGQVPSFPRPHATTFLGLTTHSTICQSGCCNPFS
jgi:hypothetical protein